MCSVKWQRGALARLADAFYVWGLGFIPFRVMTVEVLLSVRRNFDKLSAGSRLFTPSQWESKPHPEVRTTNCCK